MLQPSYDSARPISPLSDTVREADVATAAGDPSASQVILYTYLCVSIDVHSFDQSGYTDPVTLGEFRDLPGTALCLTLYGRLERRSQGTRKHRVSSP